MAIFETKFNVGDSVFRRSRVIDWANGSVSTISPYNITKVEVLSESDNPKITYRSGNGDYLDENEAVAIEEAKAIAIKHLSTRLSAVAAETVEAK